MRYIIYVGDREYQAKALLEAVKRARTIKLTTGESVRILDTFSNEYITV